MNILEFRGLVGIKGLEINLTEVTGSSRAQNRTPEIDIIEMGKDTLIEIDIREVAQGFVFLALDFINQEYVYDFINKLKAQTYIKSHRCYFDRNPIDNKV